MAAAAKALSTDANSSARPCIAPQWPVGAAEADRLGGGGVGGGGLGGGGLGGGGLGGEDRQTDTQTDARNENGSAWLLIAHSRIGSFA